MKHTVLRKIMVASENSRVKANLARWWLEEVNKSKEDTHRNLTLVCRDGVLTWNALYLFPVTSVPLWEEISFVGSRCPCHNRVTMLLPDFDKDVVRALLELVTMGRNVTGTHGDLEELLCALGANKSTGVGQIVVEDSKVTISKEENCEEDESVVENNSKSATATFQSTTTASSEMCGSSSNRSKRGSSNALVVVRKRRHGNNGTVVGRAASTNRTTNDSPAPATAVEVIETFPPTAKTRKALTVISSNYECIFCRKRTRSGKEMLEHLSVQHFQHRLQQQVLHRGPSWSTSRCHLCTFSSPCETVVLKHLGADHGAVLDLIPEQLERDPRMMALFDQNRAELGTPAAAESCSSSSHDNGNNVNGSQNEKSSNSGGYNKSAETPCFKRPRGASSGQKLSGTYFFKKS